LALQAAAVLLLAVLVLLFAKSLHDNATTVAALVKDGKHPAAPDFTLPRIDGGRDFRLASTRGSVVVLNFWASWCDPCKDEAPVLEEISRRYDGRVDVIGVNTKDFGDDARAFASRYDLTFPVVSDRGTKLYRRWGLTALPETFVIDASGRVVDHFAEPLSGPELEKALSPLIRSTAA
jgi:cytochrome c biogenesis protein CcmG/thiol:disulfide interchange protein DsbE